MIDRLDYYTSSQLFYSYLFSGFHPAMLNLFAYGNEDEDEFENRCRFTVRDQTKESQQQNQDATVDQPSTSEKSPVSLQSKTKKTKQRKVLNIEKITGVSKSELLNQDDEEENDQNKSKQSAFASDKGSLSGSDSTKSSKPESGTASNGGDIPLNPFLSNPDPGASTESAKDDSSETPYKIVYRLPPTSASEPKAAPPAPSAHAPITTGYGASYSQSQYEAFMRQSGMLESANAESTSALEFLVGIEWSLDA